ncbi:MAG TPA: hypothetical protein VN030_13555 [Cellvibrio sp.]|nr:hypothetical protein [Cellvibrio sp.]
MLKLLLPVIFPSWRFFSGIGPSPRIEFAFMQSENDSPEFWQEFRPRPLRVSWAEGVRRLLWNPRWNENLYINSCAERLFEEHSPMREQEIMRRILRALQSGEVSCAAEAKYLQFRISAVLREDGQVTQPLVFVSRPAAIGGIC